MPPYFSEAFLRDNQRNLNRKLRNAHPRRERSPAAAPLEPVLLRLSVRDDDGVLEGLAAVEGRPAPKGRHVVAEVGGVVAAALPLGPGSALADPLRPTDHLMPLLEFRAKQLTGDRPRRHSLAVCGAVRGWSRA